MGQFFPPKLGMIEVTSLYADNEMYCREVRFSVPAEKWSEFEKSPMYQQLVEYVRSVGTPDNYAPFDKILPHRRRESNIEKRQPH